MLHTTSLLLAVSASLVIASAAAATIGVRQRLRRGVWWWIAANVALAAALAAHGLQAQNPLLVPIAAGLALPWPIVTLAGIRRFYARGSSGVPASLDWVLLGLGLVGSVGLWLAPYESIGLAEWFAGAMLLATVHATLAVSRLEDFTTTPMLKAVVVALSCSALFQAAWLGVAALL